MYISVSRPLYIKPIIREHDFMDDALSETLSKLDWAILEKVQGVLALFMEL